MSASPSKADIGTQSWNVRFVPKADIPRCGKYCYSMGIARGSAFFGGRCRWSGL